jgi:D-alanyl-D-alanine endopeptidase (penicillin-binding protein 7)
MKNKLLIALLFFVNLAWARAEPSILVYNQTTGTLIVSQSTQEIRPLASITKLMTALVALDSGLELSRKITLVSNWPAVLPRKSYTRQELMIAMLIRSDNAAAETLAADYPGGRAAFLQSMNIKAKTLGMVNTHFDDASGLSKTNISTALDIQRLLVTASLQPFIREHSSKRQAEFETVVKKKTQIIVLENTNNPALFEFENIIITKTGLTFAAGWCLAVVVEQQNQTYTIVILGAKNKQDRLDKLKEIMYTHIIK